MSPVNPLPNYEDLGINKFMERSIGSNQASGSSREINFDQVATTGSMGDKIQVGGNNIIIDGSNRRIVVNDGNNDRIIIGEL